MASPNRKRLKENALVIFVLTCVLMIGGIWYESFAGSPTETPSYYRDSFQVNEDIYLTATAEMESHLQEQTGTPEPTGNPTEHTPGSGRGSGAGAGAGTGAGSNPGPDPELTTETESE